MRLWKSLQSMMEDWPVMEFKELEKWLRWLFLHWNYSFSSSNTSSITFDTTSSILSDTFIEENQIYMELDNNTIHSTKNNSSLLEQPCGQESPKLRKRKSIWYDITNSSPMKRTKISPTQSFIPSSNPISPIKDTGIIVSKFLVW